MHKATRALVDQCEGFAVETLNINSLMKTRMGKSFADAGLGEGAVRSVVGIKMA
jgi:hypothetical protein